VDNPFSFLERLTLRQAARAIAGVYIPESAQQKAVVGHWETVLTEHIHELTEDVFYRVAQVIDQPAREGWFGERFEATHKAVLTGIDRDNTTIPRARLLAWCESRNLRPPMLFPDPPHAEQPPRPSERNAPYHTPALDALKAAIHRFWLNSDPNRPPKSQEIVDWLMDAHGMTKTMAGSIDRIIRPEALRKGGNTQHSRSTFRQSES